MAKQSETIVLVSVQNKVINLEVIWANNRKFGQWCALDGEIFRCLVLIVSVLIELIRLSNF